MQEGMRVGSINCSTRTSGGTGLRCCFGAGTVLPRPTFRQLNEATPIDHPHVPSATIHLPLAFGQQPASQRAFGPLRRK